MNVRSNSRNAPDVNSRLRRLLTPGDCGRWASWRRQNMNSQTCENPSGGPCRGSEPFGPLTLVERGYDGQGEEENNRTRKKPREHNPYQTRGEGGPQELSSDDRWIGVANADLR